MFDFFSKTTLPTKDRLKVGDQQEALGDGGEEAILEGLFDKSCL